jgi:hypothetical protein
MPNNKLSNADISEEQPKQEWLVPELVVISVNGDPTISDDGLGDGTFS